MRHLLFLSISLLLFSCNDDSKDNNPSSTHIGGEIVNSNEAYLTLEKDGYFIDSIPIKKNGEFSYNLDDSNFTPGLYTFRHSPEGQVFYIEKGDSLLFRLNTKDFDESLMYTGDKAEENNFLMEMYLLNEKDNELIYSYYKISPEKFAKKTDSIKNLRMKQLTSLKEENEFSPDFISLAKKSIEYEFYDLRERYAYLINKYFNEFRNKIPKEFFSYRNDANFNDKKLQSYYIYQRFLDNYLKNKAIERCVSQPNSTDCFNTNSVKNLKNRLIISDSIFKIKSLRNRFITRFAKKQINTARNKQQIDSTLKLIKSFDFPTENYKELVNLSKLQKNYFVGSDVSQSKLIKPNAEKIILQDILSKPTISFTWSIYKAAHPKQHQRVNELRNRYPEINFLGINIDEEESYQLWVKILDNFDYNKDYEVKIRDRGKNIEFYKNFSNKVLLINKEGIIEKSNLNIFDPNFENQLLEYLNQI